MTWVTALLSGPRACQSIAGTQAGRRHIRRSDSAGRSNGRHVGRPCQTAEGSGPTGSGQPGALRRDTVSWRPRPAVVDRYVSGVLVRDAVADTLDHRPRCAALRHPRSGARWRWRSRARRFPGLAAFIGLRDQRCRMPTAMPRSATVTTPSRIGRPDHRDNGLRIV